MNQGLAFDFPRVLTEVEASGLMISSCTIQQRPNTVDALGQVDLTDLVDVPGLTDIVCMISVHSPYRPDDSAVIRKPMQLDTLAERHVFLDGFFPDTVLSGAANPEILQQYFAVVDGQLYQILTCEPDSQKITTRLGVRRYSL